MPGAWSQAPVWQEWGDLTRLLWSGRIAFAREAEYWSLRPENDERMPYLADAGGKYRTSVEHHLGVLAEPTLFYQLIFLRSYALMEQHCKFSWHVCIQGDWTLMGRAISDSEREAIDGLELSGGIEAWSEVLISRTGQNWADVFGGKAGLIEMSAVRNALTHGYNVASAGMIEKAKRRGADLPYEVGQALAISFDGIHRYRGQMRSFCRILSDGIAHLARGTHRGI